LDWQAVREKTPCSVNTNGNADLGRLVLDVITNCDEIEVHSSTESRNIKSPGMSESNYQIIKKGWGQIVTTLLVIHNTILWPDI